MKRKEISRSIELRINRYGDIAISVNPNFFVTEKEKKAEVNGNEVLLWESGKSVITKICYLTVINANVKNVKHNTYKS